MNRNYYRMELGFSPLIEGLPTIITPIIDITL